MMKSVTSLCVGAALIFGTIITLGSCQNDIISEPTVSEITSSTSSKNSTSISAPYGLKATHGGYRKVSLLWGAVTGATQYKIYAADTPYDTFYQVAETKDSTSSIEITEQAGTSRYYRVSAVNYSKIESGMSNIAYGSTLATPIITGITKGSDGTNVTVSWWMANCDSTTYASAIRYELHCYAEDGTTAVGEPVPVSDGKTSATITGLTGKTSYYFQVAAFLNSDQSDNATELSDRVNEETAHRLIPDAALQFSAAQGTSTSGITLSWTLPDSVDYAVSAGGYERHPVYFTLKRKPADGPDTSYITIASYIGAVKAEDTAHKIYRFDCADGSTNSANITTAAADSEYAASSEQNALYETYTSYAKITFTDDKELARGTKYTYRLSSFVDDTSKIISADTAITEAEGHLISEAKLNFSATYEENDEKTAFTRILVKYTVTFNALGVTDGYNYVLEEGYTPFATESDPSPATEYSIARKTASAAELSSYLRDFDFSGGSVKDGYYRYSLYIVQSGESDYKTNYYTLTPAAGQVTVTNDPSKIVRIKYFSVADGFKDKFLLTWDYDAACSYKIEYLSSKDNFAEPTTINLTQEQVNELAESKTSKDITVEGENETVDVLTYADAAESGEKRIYTLYANCGIEDSKTLQDENEDIRFETLGTPELTFDKNNADYKTITVTWASVQKAKPEAADFTVEAWYDDDEAQTNLAVLDGEDKNTTITKNDDGTYTAVLEEPTGYNNALRAGLPISLRVTAKSATQDDTTQATTETKNLGPALLNTSILKEDADYIQISWSKVDGAKGYLVHRVLYDNTARSAVSGNDVYYCYNDEETTAISVGGEAIESDTAKLEIPADFVFTDKYIEKTSDENAQYYNRQAKIPWGLPYDYTVIPVKTKNDFEFTGSQINEENSVLTYSNLSPKTAATYGYGLNVWAHKAENATMQQIEWTLPYHTDLKPTVYRRNYDSTENIWEKLDKDLQKGETSLSYSPDKKTAAYEYAVCYKKTADTISLPESFITFTDPGSSMNLAAKETSGQHYNYTNKLPEKLNKGYLLATTFSARYGGKQTSDGKSYEQDERFYSEFVNWKEWDYSERSIGPSAAYISIKNYNLSNSWIKIATLDENLHFASAESLTNTSIWNSGDEAIYLAPETVANTSSLLTEGVMQVLRDAKHYYSITLDSVTIGDDDSVYAYRQISTTELIRSAMIQMNDVMYRVGKLDFENKSGSGSIHDVAADEDRDFGSYAFAHQSTINMGKEYKYSITNYSSDMSSPSNSAVSSVQISVPESSTYRNQLGTGGYPKSFNSTTITVRPNDSENKLETYSGTITLSISSYKSASLSCNGTSISISDSTTRRNWIPFKLDDDDDWYHENSSYKWWN